MGSTRMTPYRIKAYFVDFQNKCHGVATFGSDMKNPTPAKLQDWRKNYNASMEPGQCNEHLAKVQSPYGTVICIDQRTGQEVARYTPPAFEVVGTERI